MPHVWENWLRAQLRPPPDPGPGQPLAVEEGADGEPEAEGHICVCLHFPNKDDSVLCSWWGIIRQMHRTTRSPLSQMVPATVFVPASHPAGTGRLPWDSLIGHGTGVRGRPPRMTGSEGRALHKGDRRWAPTCAQVPAGCGTLSERQPGAHCSHYFTLHGWKLQLDPREAKACTAGWDLTHAPPTEWGAWDCHVPGVFSAA